MLISILTFQGFNELDSFIALGVLNRIKKPNWRVEICCPEKSVTSMNGVTVLAQSRLEQLHLSDAVIVGSGMLTREVVKNPEIMQLLQEGLAPSKQLIGAQCSGTLILAQLGLLGQIPACTDLITKPWVQESGVNVLNTPFYAKKNIATAGGCLASQYLAAWIIAKSEGLEAAKEAMHYVAPVGEKEDYVGRAMANIEIFL
jgi:transcriptional regulator GlxA family with amidase domain